jgi:hypothetical protein
VTSPPCLPSFRMKLATPPRGIDQHSGRCARSTSLELSGLLTLRRIAGPVHSAVNAAQWQRVCGQLNDGERAGGSSGTPIAIEFEVLCIRRPQESAPANSVIENSLIDIYQPGTGTQSYAAAVQCRRAQSP